MFSSQTSGRMMCMMCQDFCCEYFDTKLKCELNGDLCWFMLALANTVEILLRRSAAEPQKIATESAAAGNAQIKFRTIRLECWC